MRMSYVVTSLVGLLMVANADAVAQGRVEAAHNIPKYDGRDPDMSKPVQVFILMGQSNMLGFGKTFGDAEGTVEFAVKTKDLYPYLVDEAGNWVTRKDVRNVRVMNDRQFNNEWLTLPRGAIGPEIGIGHHLGNVIDAPVLILKSCIGNRSLGWDLLPPGTPSYDGQPGYRGTPANPEMSTEKPDAGWYAGKQYDDDMDAAKRVLNNLDKYVPGAKGYEVVGFFWWQGDKDMRNATHSKHYEANLVRLIHALRKEFDAPNAKFVSATLGQTTMQTGGGQGQLRDAKFAIADPKKHPAFAGQVGAVFTNPISKGGSSSGHYSNHGETYMNVGEAMGWAMAELLKGGGGGGGQSARVASTGSSTSAAAGGASRAARRITPENFKTVQQSLRQALTGLSSAGKLEEVPLSLSITQSGVWLQSARADGTMTFRIVGSDRTADVPWTALTPHDQAVLAMLAARLQASDANAQGLAGVYAELMGVMPQASEYFGKAGGERAKWEGLLH